MSKRKFYFETEGVDSKGRVKLWLLQLVLLILTKSIHESRQEIITLLKWNWDESASKQPSKQPTYKEHDFNITHEVGCCEPKTECPRVLGGERGW
jgi:hypothetical protein